VVLFDIKKDFFVDVVLMILKDVSRFNTDVEKIHRGTGVMFLDTSNPSNKFTHKKIPTEVEI
jgi:hypothetical protein